jgi:hypothetical protein
MALVKIKNRYSGEVKFFTTLWDAQKFCRQKENLNKYTIV